jgi:AcrR family transcriptional regulator
LATKRKTSKKKTKRSSKTKAKVSGKKAVSRSSKAAEATAAPAKQDAPDDRMGQITLAAFHCFSERGFHDTRVDDICKEAGASKGSFYWYFESKEAVFLHILEVWADEVEREVMEQFRAAFEQDDPVSALLAALGREGRRGRKLLPVWLDGLVQSQRNEKLRESLAQFMARVRHALYEVIRPAFAPYHDDEQVRMIAGLLFSCFIGAVSQHLADPEGGHYDEQVRQLLVTTERFASLLTEREPGTAT